MQNWNSYLLVGMSDGTTTLENILEVSEKVDYTIQRSHS